MTPIKFLKRKETTFEIYFKHYIKKILGKPDPRWPLFVFEKNINSTTKQNHHEILQWAEQCLKDKEVFELTEKYLKSTDPIVQQGFALKQKIEKEFKNKYSQTKKLNILIHIPDQYKSPAGYSLFNNFLEAFQFLGIQAHALQWNDDIKKILDVYRPTVFLSSDHEIFLSRIDWNAVKEYKKNNTLLLGLTAGLEEYGNTPLPQRIAWAKEHAIDFYYTYRDAEYINSKPEYKLFFDAGYKILPLMFGANIQTYYPIPDIERDINYTFLASQNKTKAPEYASYLEPIVSNNAGFIDGPGWSFIDNFTFNRDRDRYIYARTKVGINMHLPEQRKYTNEVNERVYMLAACGVPQINDDAKLLHKLFSEESVYIAKNPHEYQTYFKEIISNPKEAERRALIAQKETFENYTTFHRVENFLKALYTLHLADLGTLG